MIETHKTNSFYQSAPDRNNPILSRTLEDEPVNEKLIRGMQALEATAERLIQVHGRMITNGHLYADAVEMILNDRRKI
jgi:hypothetical protein